MKTAHDVAVDEVANVLIERCSSSLGRCHDNHHHHSDASAAVRAIANSPEVWAALITKHGAFVGAVLNDLEGTL